MLNSLHPATRLVGWIALIVFVQLARGPLLWGFGLVFVALGLSFARQRGLRLIRRARFLMIVLVVLFTFFTPGEALVSALGQLGPTHEGLALAASHGVRLLSVLILVALLLETTDERTLVSGLMSLAAPLGVFGFPVERLALRLLLVMAYVERPPEGGWKALLDGRADLPPGQGLWVRRQPLAMSDRFVIGALLALMAWGAIR